MSIKQKIIKTQGADRIKEELDIALQMGWLVQTLTVNSETGAWIAVLYREAA
jgi:hypothetical protein